MQFLMVLSTVGQPAEAIEAAVDFAAAKQASLAVVFVLDETVSEAIFEKLTDIGFIGEKPGTELESAVSAEYRRQAEEALAEVGRIADERDVTVTSEITAGEFLDKSLDAVAKYAADTLIIIRTRQSWLARTFGSTGVGELVRLAPCEIKVFEA